MISMTWPSHWSFYNLTRVMLKHSTVKNCTFHRQWLPQARETSVALGKVENPIIFDSHLPVYSLAS